MGAIQNSINTALGAMGSTAAVASYLKEQDVKKEAEIKSLEHQIDSNKIAQEFDTKEAAAAIKAHADKEGLTKEEIDSLNETDIDKLGENVQAIREGKLMENRMADLEKGETQQPYYQDKKTGKFISKGKFLDKAYEAERELKDRILASKQLKFNIEEATARLKVLEGR